MAINQHVVNFADTPLQTKLKVLSESLHAALGTPSVATREAYLSEAARILGHFYRKLDKPIFEARETLSETLPDLTDYNSLFVDTQTDLNILFSQLENAEDFVLQNFNYFAAEGSRLNRQLRELSSRYTDFALYTGTISSNFIFWKDSFVNTAKLDLETNLLNKPLCEINQVEGIITLPINLNSDSRVVPAQTTILNESSNGVLGNNQQLGIVNRRSDPSVILDLNPDTWVEYERVVRVDDRVPLVMDLLMTLADTRVINFIRINPNNFGQQAPVTINDIATSVNGKDYISIKDEIPIAGFLAEDEENTFTLAASTSKFAGQGLYTFTARKAKYVRITLTSSSPYLINTSSGQKTRYAIGIRDIDIRAFNYQPEGEIVSTQIVPSDEVKKVILEANQNPVEKSELVSITHQISPDDGITWYDIQPKDFPGSDVPEVLDFNGVTPNTINTPNPVYTLKWKALLSRNTPAFAGGLIEQKLAEAREVHSIGAVLPGKFKLQHTPIRDSIRISDPAFGARGFEDVNYLTGIGTGQQITIKLPWKRIQKDLVKSKHTDGYGTYSESDPEVVEINGDLCTRVTSLSGYSAGDRVYTLDYTTGELRAIPEKDAEVRIRFTRERAYPAGDSDKHYIRTKFPLTPDPKLVDIYVVGETTQTSEILPKNVTEVTLQNQSVVSGTIAFDSGTLASADYDNGVITLTAATSKSADRSVSYAYVPKRKLSTDEWKFDISSGERVININNDSFDTVSVSNEVLEQSTLRMDLTNQGIVRGSLKFTLPSGVPAGSASDPFRKEIAYIDGATEFLHLQRTQEVIDSPTASGTNEYRIQLSQPAVGSKISFSKSDLFELNPEATVADVTVDDEWAVESSTIIVWHQAGTLPSDLGSVHYYFSDPTHSSAGEYSVDYDRGIIAVPTVLSNANDFLVDYRYTNYEIDYYVARDIPTDNFTVDLERNLVSFTDTEVLHRGKFKSAGKTYHITYNYIQESRTDAEELEPYFTPVLKDYSLKILTKNRMSLV